MPLDQQDYFRSTYYHNNTISGNKQLKTNFTFSQVYVLNHTQHQVCQFIHTRE